MRHNREGHGEAHAVRRVWGGIAPANAGEIVGIKARVKNTGPVLVRAWEPRDGRVEVTLHVALKTRIGKKRKKKKGKKKEKKGKKKGKKGYHRILQAHPSAPDQHARFAEHVPRRVWGGI